MQLCLPMWQFSTLFLMVLPSYSVPVFCGLKQTNSFFDLFLYTTEFSTIKDTIIPKCFVILPN